MAFADPVEFPSVFSQLKSSLAFAAANKIGIGEYYRAKSGLMEAFEMLGAATRGARHDGLLFMAELYMPECTRRSQPKHIGELVMRLKTGDAVRLAERAANMSATAPEKLHIKFAFREITDRSRAVVDYCAALRPELGRLFEMQMLRPQVSHLVNQTLMPPRTYFANDGLCAVAYTHIAQDHYAEIPIWPKDLHRRVESLTLPAVRI